MKTNGRNKIINNFHELYSDGLSLSSLHYYGLPVCSQILKSKAVPLHETQALGGEEV
jgi:hypothetical protein